MDSGYYAACAGLKARTQALEMVANNLANLNTTGYRPRTRASDLCSRAMLQTA